MSVIESNASRVAHAPEAISDDAATEFLHDLVATPSVSPGERQAVKRFVAEAAALGLDAEIDQVGNGIARTPHADTAKHTIMLLGHIDTVPGNIHVHVEDGVLHGRGSVDAKGPLATMLFAAARARLPEHVAVCVAAALGEETADSVGANFIARTIRPDACIIAEPSGWDGVTLGYKGCLTVRATTQCHAAHSAGPDQSAPDRLVEWWMRVLEYVTTVNAAADQIFDHLQASILAWRSQSDGMNNRASLTANFRLPLAILPEAMRQTLTSFTTPEVKLEFFGGEQAYLTPRDDLVVRSLSAAIRKEGAPPRHKRKTGTADFNVVAPVWRCPIAAYGPGDSSLDHTPEERLPLDEFHKAIRVVTQAIELMVEAFLTGESGRAM